MRNRRQRHELQKYDIDRLRPICSSLGTSFDEFIIFATRQAMDECEGYAQDEELIRRFYQRGAGLDRFRDAFPQASTEDEEEAQTAEAVQRQARSDLRASS